MIESINWIKQCFIIGLSWINPISVSPTRSSFHPALTVRWLRILDLDGGLWSKFLLCILLVVLLSAISPVQPPHDAEPGCLFSKPSSQQIMLVSFLIIMNNIILFVIYLCFIGYSKPMQVIPKQTNIFNDEYRLINF